MVNNGLTIYGSGTSASAPTFAAVVSLLNSARIESGQSPLGFLNPFLYSTGVTALNDITTGKTKGCTQQIPGAGFNATCGWDAATGLGTPDFGKLLALVAPLECNVGGVLANPTATACDVAANSALSSSLVAGKTYCPITITPSSTNSGSTTMVTSTSSATASACNHDNC